MKKFSKICLLGLAIAFTQGCGSSADRMASREEKAKNMENAESSPQSALAGSDGKSEQDEQTDSIISPFVPSSVSRIGRIDSIKKFIRTADIKFKVKNVERSTYKIEDIVAHFEGFVTDTHLASRINYTESFRIKEDSLLQRVHYVVENNMTFRVPKALLDTTLKQIVSQIDFLDYRIIKAEDVSFVALKNKLSTKRYTKHEERLTQAINNNKTKNVLNAENSLLSTQEQADENMVAELELKDKIEYSTVQLLIYQDEKVKTDKVFSEERTPSYKPSFGKEFNSSIKLGWEIVEFLFLLLVKLWPFILIGFGVYFGVKKLMKKKV
jgi:hypothetical protein